MILILILIICKTINDHTATEQNNFIKTKKIHLTHGFHTPSECNAVRLTSDRTLMTRIVLIFADQICVNQFNLCYLRSIFLLYFCNTLRSAGGSAFLQVNTSEQIINLFYKQNYAIGKDFCVAQIFNLRFCKRTD